LYTLQILARRSKGLEGKTVCFLNLGNLYTDLAIFWFGEESSDPRLVFSRKIPIAGIDIVKALTGALVTGKGKISLSMNEARKVVEDIGIPEGGSDELIEGKITRSQIMSMLLTPLDRLVEEIGRCFDYYRETSSGEAVDLLMLFGTQASMNGLVPYLSEKLEIEVKLGNPLEGLDVRKGALDKEQKISKVALSTGAALSEAKGISLLPIEIKEETKRTYRRAALQGVATAVILVLALLYIGMRIQLNNYKRRIRVAEMELSSLQHALKKAEANYLANKVFVNEPYWEDVFLELSNLIPKNIYLTEFAMANGIIRLKGIASGDEGEQLISNFIIVLEEGIFKNVKLVKVADLSEEPGNEFELKCFVD
jgi:hypothetical protein